jgi:hypothetical protein
MGGGCGTGEALNLEAKTKEYATCLNCNEKSVLAEEKILLERAPCYNPKCKSYKPPHAALEEPFSTTIPFLRYCIATGPSGFYKKYIEEVIKLTEETHKKYGLG